MALTPAAEIDVASYIELNGNLAFKVARNDMERYLKQGRRLKIITSEKLHGYNATLFYKVSPSDREGIATLLASTDLIFTGSFECERNNLGWYAASKGTINKILNDCKPHFSDEKMFQTKKSEAEAEALREAELKELAALKKISDRTAYLTEKYEE